MTAVFSLLSVLFCQFATRETPKYLLLTAKNLEEAKESIAFYQGPRTLGEEEEIIATILRERELESHSDSDDESECTLFQRLKHLLTIHYLLLAMLLGFCAMQILIGPVYYETVFLKKARLGEHLAQLFTALVTVVALPCGILGSIFVHKFSIRTLLLTAGAIHLTSIAFLTVFLYLAENTYNLLFAYGCVAALLFDHIATGLGLGIIPYYLTSTLLPQQYRSIGQSLIFFVTLWPNFGIQLITLDLYNRWGALTFIPLYLLPEIPCLLLLFFYLPQTKGREMDEIVTDLKRHSIIRRVCAIIPSQNKDDKKMSDE